MRGSDVDLRESRATCVTCPHVQKYRSLRVSSQLYLQSVFDAKSPVYNYVVAWKKYNELKNTLGVLV